MRSIDNSPGDGYHKFDAHHHQTFTQVAKNHLSEQDPTIEKKQPFSVKNQTDVSNKYVNTKRLKCNIYLSLNKKC